MLYYSGLLFSPPPPFPLRPPTLCQVLPLSSSLCNFPLSSQVFSKLMEPVMTRLSWPVSLLPSFLSGATLGLRPLTPLNNNYKKPN